MGTLIRDDARVPLGETLDCMRREARRRLRSMAVLFALIALGALLVGWHWPKKYHAAATILVSEDKSIEKLMEGRAVATSVSDRAMIAREVMFSRDVMDDVLTLGGWMGPRTTPAERARLVEMIESRTVVGTPRENLIRIQFWDQDPERARQVANRFAERFMAESSAAQVRESREAHDFIAEQAARYRARLDDAEAALAAYRAEHPEARSEPTALMESRLATLRRRLEADQARLDAGMTPVGTGLARPDAPHPERDHLAALQRELATQRLQRTDAHPEVRRLQQQVEAQRAVVAQLPMPTTPASARTPDLGAIRARIAATERELEQEMQRARTAADPAPALAELTRELEVTRDIYQDLLRRLEFARLSLTLDEEGRGMSLRTHEAAELPARPSGPRFAHFALGGLAAAAAMPLGLLFLFIRLDPHLRSGAAVVRGTGLPVIASLPPFWSRADQRLLKRDVLQAGTLVAITLAVVAAASLYKVLQA